MKSETKTFAERTTDILKSSSFKADLMRALFVEAILESLERLGMSKATLAEKLGVSRQYVQKILNVNATGNLSLETICKFAEVLNFEADLGFSNLRKNQVNESHFLQEMSSVADELYREDSIFSDSHFCNENFTSDDHEAVSEYPRGPNEPGVAA